LTIASAECLVQPKQWHAKLRSKGGEVSLNADVWIFNQQAEAIFCGLNVFRSLEVNFSQDKQRTTPLSAI
jgi:hypothetical protein